MIKKQKNKIKTKKQRSKAKQTGCSPIKLRPGAEEKGYLCDSKKPLALDYSTTDPKGHRCDKGVNIVAAGRTEGSLGWVLQRSRQWHGHSKATRRVQPGAPAALRLSSTSASHPGLTWGIRSVGLTPFSPAAIKMNGVSFHNCPKEGSGDSIALTCSHLKLGHLMVTIYKVRIFKAISLHVADAINSTAGGWEQWGIVGGGGGGEPNQKGY